MSYVKEKKSEYPFVCHNVKHVARRRIDDGKTMDSIIN